MKKIVFTICLIAQQITFCQGITEHDIIDLFNNYKFNNPVEYSFISTDRQIYFSGESIKLSIVIFDQYYLPTKLSKVCYLELLHESGDYSTKYAMRLDSGLVNSQISLPTNIPSGNYQLIVHTNFMRNYDLKQHTHRIPLYVQNTLADPGKVARSIEYPDVEFEAEYENQIDINVTFNDSKVFLEFVSLLPGSSYFLVNEGVNGVQFVAKVDLKRGRTNIGISKEKFSGNFQKLVLIDTNKDIFSIRGFYLDTNIQAQGPFQTNKLGEDFKNNVLTRIAVYKEEPFDMRQHELAEHVYRLFYKLPRAINIDEMAFEKLTSDSIMNSFSKYSFQEWSSILESEAIKDIFFYPEKNIQLRGKVEGPEELLKSSNIIFHFFKNNLDLSAPLDKSGEFTIDLIFPVGQDYVSFSVVENRTLKDISDRVNTEIEKNADFLYNSNVVFYDRDLTNDYINSQLEWKYALSTFYDQEKLKTYFWEDYSFDMTFKSDDYVRLEDFEDFIKEAVMNASVVEDRGVKSVNVYNGFNGSFEKPQLIIHNNRALRDETELFSLSFEEIDSVLIAFNPETIRNFGSSFNRGIIAVVSNVDNYSEFKERENDFIPFTGYHHFKEKNLISKKFSTTLFFEINSEFQLSEEFVTEENYQYIESIERDGTINFYINKWME